MICRDGSVGAAGQTAPTKSYEPPLKIDSIVVIQYNLIWTDRNGIWIIIIRSTYHYYRMDLLSRLPRRDNDPETKGATFSLGSSSWD